MSADNLVPGGSLKVYVVSYRTINASEWTCSIYVDREMATERVQELAKQSDIADAWFTIENMVVPERWKFPWGDEDEG